jgi:hypothetical protein
MSRASRCVGAKCRTSRWTTGARRHDSSFTRTPAAARRLAAVPSASRERNVRSLECRRWGSNPHALAGNGF